MENFLESYPARMSPGFVTRHGSFYDIQRSTDATRRLDAFRLDR
jgi:hypothetical protein